MSRLYLLHALGQPAEAKNTNQPGTAVQQSQYGTDYDLLEIRLNIYQARFYRAEQWLRHETCAEEANEEAMNGDGVVRILLYLSAIASLISTKPVSKLPS